MAAPTITFALQAVFSAPEEWLQLARLAEADGFEALCVPDHPGTTGSPFVALSAAAAVTERIELGTAVVNGGVAQPLALASDVATLDVLSGGRAYLGLGAGHTPAEWEMVGRGYPSPRERVDRFAELLATVPALVAGEKVNFHGSHVDLVDARLALVAGRRVPLLVGGSNRRLLRLGAQQADVVEISGSGRTLSDGHYHEVRWSPTDVESAVALVHEGAASAGRSPQLGAFVQVAELAEDAEQWVARWIRRAAEVVPKEALPSVADALSAPYVLVGTAGQIADKVTALAARFGISRYTVRSRQAAASVLAELRARRADGA